MLLLGVPQEVAKKGTKGTPHGPPLPDGVLRAAGAFTFASLLHLGRMSARPRWVCHSKSFCFPRLPLVLAKGEAQRTRTKCSVSVKRRSRMKYSHIPIRNKNKEDPYKEVFLQLYSTIKILYRAEKRINIFPLCPGRHVTSRRDHKILMYTALLQKRHGRGI